MGTKRVGLARIQALIENLKRSINLTDATLTSPTITNAASISCLGNTNITGILTVDTTSVLTGAVQSGGLLKATNKALAAGGDIADSGAAVTLVVGDHGKNSVCLLDGASKTVNLPASMTIEDVGTTFTIIQGVSLIASGVLTINANTGNTFSTNSYYLGYASSLYVLPIRPSAANTRIVITGANTHSAWGIGSKAVFTCVSAGEWQFEMTAQPLGTGNAAVAFSTP
jgi:hypothetical protein